MRLNRRSAKNQGSVFSIGLKAASVSDVTRQLKAGLPFASIEKLQNALGLPLDRVAQLARISGRTLARRRREGRLSLDESERVYRLGSVHQRALALFEGDADGANRWLKAPRPVFGGKSALEFSGTEVGAREVEDTIERIEYGIFQ